MLTLPEIEKAVDALTADQKRELHRYLENSLQHVQPSQTVSRAHSVLEIPAVRLGTTLVPHDEDDDLLGEMLDGRS